MNGPFLAASARTVILLAISILAVSVAFVSRAQAPELTWRWSNPAPHGANVIGMIFTNGIYAQIGEAGQVFQSVDLLTWRPVHTGTRKALRAITSFQGKFVITGESGTVLIGDSLDDLDDVSVATEDWLESVTVSPDLIIAAGDNGAIYRSANGTNWQRRAVPFSDWLRGIAYGTPESGSLFVVVGELGFVATSPDGIEWTPQDQLTDVDLNAIRWIDGRFWIAGDAGEIFESADGFQWTAVQTGAVGDLFMVNGRPGAILVGGEDELWLRSENGTWTNQLGDAAGLPAPLWTYLTALSDGTSLLAAGRTGMLVEGFQTNSVSPHFWLPVSDSVRNWLWSVESFPQTYLAVGDHATILSSLNGVEWHQEVPPESASDAVLLGLGGRTNLAVAVGSGGTIMLSPDDRRLLVSTNASGQLVTNEVSTLGIVWQAVWPPPVTDDLQGVAVDGDTIVVSGGNGVILVSQNGGGTWARRALRTSAFLSSVAAFPGGFVATGDDGTIFSSSDTVTWSRRTSNTTSWLYRVRYIDGQLIVVGQNGTLLTSTDGVSWESRWTGTSAWLNDVRKVGDWYFLVGNQGTVLTSTDLDGWTHIGTLTLKSLYGAAASDGQLIVAGVEGTILRTRVLPISSPVDILEFRRQLGREFFLFSGVPDQPFSLESSTNLTEWTTEADLEILDPSGTLIHVEEAVPNGEARFFRTRTPPEP